ncbi:MAG: hypothetical protein WCM93_04090 [Bacteroidota bacterium]
MIHSIKTFFTIVFLVSILLTIETGLADAQPAPPMQEHLVLGNQPPGGGAPIEDGTLFLLLLAATYGFKKIIDGSQKKRGEKGEDTQFKSVLE